VRPAPFATVAPLTVALAAESLLASGRECHYHRAAARLILKYLCRGWLAMAWARALSRAPVLNDYLPADTQLPTDWADALSRTHHRASPVYHFH